jgi:hypothetical protein
VSPLEAFRLRKTSRVTAPLGIVKMVDSDTARKAWGARATIETKSVDWSESPKLEQHFVAKFKPVVVRRFAPEWARRMTLEGLASSPDCTNPINQIVTEPVPEWAPDYGARISGQTMDFQRFIALVADNESYIQAYAAACSGPLASVCPTEEEIAPVAALLKASRYYSSVRAFLASRGFTDWHWHFTDETLTVQLIGKKEIYLVAPDRFSFMMNLAVTAGRQGTIVGLDNPDLEGLSIYRAELRPGDALYLPLYWWHMARSFEPVLTAAITFRSPLHVAMDLRLAAARHILRHLFTSPRDRKHIPLALLGAAYACPRNWLLGFDPRKATPGAD